MTIRRILAILMLIVTTQLASQAQSNQFRDSRAHLGVGIGLFTYHGPIDLTQPRSRANFVREHEPRTRLFRLFSYRAGPPFSSEE